MTQITINDGDSIKSYLLERGATPQQCSGKTVNMLIQGIMDKEISTSQAAQEQISLLEKRVDNAARRAFEINNRVQAVDSRYSEIEELLEQAEQSAKEKTISDGVIVDAVNAFTRMLESVRDVFGAENMSEAVMCSAISAASYGYWRNVMGPKTEGEAKRRHDERARF